MNEHGDKFVKECLFLVEEGVGITYGTAQDAADDVACLSISWQLTVGNREGYGADVVGNDAHSNVGLFLVAVFLAAEALYLVNHRLENVSVVVGVLALEGTYQTLEPHTGVDNVHRQRLQGTVSLAVELHEHDVPYLYDLWVVLVYQLSSGHLCLLLGGAAVKVYLRTGTAGTGVAHLPEVVVLVTINNMVLADVLAPVACRLVVAGKSFAVVALEYCYVQVLRVEFQYIYKVFPSHIYGAFLEVVAERPVAEHLEHGMVIGVVTYFLQVVVLAADAQTLL